MRRRGGDGSAPYCSDYHLMDELPYRCHFRILTTRSCPKLATWATPSSARYCDDHRGLVGAKIHVAPYDPGSHERTGDE